MIIEEVNERDSLKMNLRKLFFICLIYSNVTKAFTEHLAFFDEDEKEIKRQLNIGIKAYIGTVISISLSAFLINPLISSLGLIIYFIWVLKYAVDWYKPLSKKIKTSAQN